MLISATGADPFQHRVVQLVWIALALRWPTLRDRIGLIRKPK
jgi:hypothetical protein